MSYFLRQRAACIAGKFTVEVFAVFRDDKGAARPEAGRIDRMDDDQAAADVLWFQITTQFDGCGDAGVFAAVDAGSEQAVSARRPGH